MARPTVFGRWATDAVYNAIAGLAPTVTPGVTPVRVVPPAGVREQGIIPGLGVPSQYLNWLLENVTANVEFLFARVYQNDEDHWYETAKLRQTLYPLHHGFPYNTAPADWTEFRGLYRESAADDAAWVIPLRGIPVGSEIVSVQARVDTNNAARGATPKARMDLVRYQGNRLVSGAINPLTLEGALDGVWETVTGGFAPPGPYYVEFPGLAGQTIAGWNTNSFFIQDNSEYGIRIWAGTDAGGHVPDKFFGVYVAWNDFGPRSGG